LQANFNSLRNETSAVQSLEVSPGAKVNVPVLADVVVVGGRRRAVHGAEDMVTG
jgi:hypothetical protein